MVNKSTANYFAGERLILPFLLIRKKNKKKNFKGPSLSKSTNRVSALSPKITKVHSSATPMIGPLIALTK